MRRRRIAQRSAVAEVAGTDFIINVSVAGARIAMEALYVLNVPRAVENATASTPRSSS